MTKSGSKDEESGRRSVRGTTFEAEAYSDSADPMSRPILPSDLVDPDVTGAPEEGVDAFRERTAMFDKGEFLGELADLEDRPPDTRTAEVFAQPPKGFRLIVVKGPELGVEWAFKQPEIVIGRDEDCGLVLTDIAVSRRHARVVLREDRLVVEDLESGNGTFVNGVRVDTQPLSPGDELTIGDRTFRFVELNEAPPTAAAHPARSADRSAVAASFVAAGMNASLRPRSIAGEPSLPSALPSLDGRDGVVRGPSSVGSVPLSEALGGPSAGAPVVGPARGAALRSVAWGAGLTVLAATAAFSTWWYFDQKAESERRARLELGSRREFLQAVELVKARRFGDATILLERVLRTRPAYARAQEYLDHSQTELEVWRDLEAAAAHERQGRFGEALKILEAVPADSAYGKEFRALRKRLDRRAVSAMVIEARLRFQTSDLKGAETLVDRALATIPNHREASALKREIAKEVQRRQIRATVKKPPEAIPKELERAVALYIEGKLTAAIDAAEAAGGPRAAAFIEKVTRVGELRASAANASRRKVASEILEAVPEAIDLDQQIAGGRGRVRQDILEYYVNGLYLTGVEAYYRKDFVEAFDKFSQALRIAPDHKLAETWLADLAEKAKDLFAQASQIKDSDPSAARTLFTQVKDMTPPSNEHHRLALKWLRSTSLDVPRPTGDSVDSKDTDISKNTDVSTAQGSTSREGSPQP